MSTVRAYAYTAAMPATETLLAVRLDALRRVGLAEERQRLWNRLGHMKSADPLRHSVVLRVHRLTAELNGHDADLDYGTAGARAGSGGGLYERKRHDRAALETQLGIHEFFLDSAGRKVRST